MSIDVTADAGSENQLGAQVSAPTVWELTFAEPAMLLPSVPEPRRQRILYEQYEERHGHRDQLKQRGHEEERAEQSERAEHREQLRLELPASEPSNPELPQAQPPDSEVMPYSSQDLRVGHRRLLPKWTGWVLLALGVLTLPWVAGLAVELPSRSEAAHYDVSWAGFDVLLCALLLRTGWSALHDLEHVEVTAAMTGSLLIVDAWFDVMSAPDTRQFLIALAMALCVELPLAGFCLWIAGRVEFERRRRSEVLTALVRRFENRRRNRPRRSTQRSTQGAARETARGTAPGTAEKPGQVLELVQEPESAGDDQDSSAQL